MMNAFAPALLVALLACSPASAETPRFTRAIYYNTYSLAHPPAPGGIELPLKPGR